MDWTRVRAFLTSELRALQPEVAFSSLAAGTDQLFAEIAIELGCALEAVLPMRDYRSTLKEEALANYDRLASLAHVTTLDGRTDQNQAFYEAGVYVVDHCQVVLAVWDEQPSRGFGGTADIVKYALLKQKDTRVFNPVTFDQKTFFSGGDFEWQGKGSS